MKESSLLYDEKIAVLSTAIAGFILYEQTSGNILRKMDKTLPEDIDAYNTMPLSTLGLAIRDAVLNNKDKKKRGLSVDGSLLLYIKNLTPILQPEGALDVFGEEELGANGMPSDVYPSDHLAICANFRLTWEVNRGASAVDSAGDVYVVATDKWVPWTPTQVSDKSTNSI